MLMPQNENKRAEAILLLARAALRDRRRRSPVALLIVAATLIAIFSLLAWWIWLRPQPLPLQLAAFDQLAVPDERVTVAARVQPLDEESSEADLAHCDLYFEQLGSG